MLNTLNDDSQLAVLAARYRTAFDKTKAGRELWIEGTLELAAVMLDARNQFPDHREYNRWVNRNQLEHIDPSTRSALIGIGEIVRKDMTVGRKLLEENSQLAWRTIWEKRAERPNRHPSDRGKGEQSTVRGRLSGSAQRKRAKRIPTVMQDDYEPPPRPERKGVTLRGLTREQVDPDFVGTSLEFATKYGHVNLHTKDEIEHHKQQEALSAWLGTMTDFYNAACAMVTALNTLDTATLQEWKAKPGKAIKLQAWRDRCELACKKLETL